MSAWLSWLSQHRYWAVAILALLSRVVFVDGGVDWFDSSQYLVRSQDPDFIHALSTGHGPFHPGYILWTWLAVHLLSWTHASPAYLIGLTTALFGAGALAVFFTLAERWTNARTAALATLLAGLTPFLWVGSIGILIDPVMIFWYLLALLLIDLTVEQMQNAERRTQNQTQNVKYFGSKTLSDFPFGSSFFILHSALATGLALGLSMLAHTQIALWGLGFVSVLIFRWPLGRSYRAIARSLLSLWPILVGPLLAVVVYCYLLVHAGHDPNWWHAFQYLVSGNAGDHAPFTLGFAWRNWRAVAGSTFALTSIGALVWLTIRRPRLGLTLLVWFLPGLIISASYLYSNLYGRASMIAIFPASLATAILLTQNVERFKKLTIVGSSFGYSFSTLRSAFGVLLIGALLAQSLPLVWRYAHGLSTAEEQGTIQRQLGSSYVLQSGENVTFRGTESYDTVQVQTETEIQAHVRERLVAGQPVYVASDAWRWPFAKLDGRNLRIDSLETKGPGEHGSATSYLADMGTLRLAQLAPSDLSWSTYQLQEESLPLADRINHASELLEQSGNHQTVVVGRFMSGEQPVSHLLVDLYCTRFVHVSRFDANDWLVRLAQRLTNRRDPLAWSYTDTDGIAELALPRVESPRLEAVVASTDRLFTAPVVQATTGKTVATDHRSVSPSDGLIQHFKALTDLINAVGTLSPTQSALVKLQDRSGDRIDALLWTFNYTLPLTDTIEAEDLSLSDAATVVTRQNASNSAEVRFAPHSSGSALYGPYRTLPPGHYRLEYALAAPVDADPTWQLATLQAAGELEGKHLATSQPISVADVRRGPIPLEFTLDQPTDFLEFRVLPLGAPTSFTLDYLRLTRVDN